jgi:hypothetical protein
MEQMSKWVINDMTSDEKKGKLVNSFEKEITQNHLLKLKIIRR